MNSCLRHPLFAWGLVVVWRVLLLVFTAQPIPANDAYGYDGGVVNYLHTGHYCNPSLALIFPISGTQVYATYPPMYQAALLVWMTLFGTSVLSAMALHAALFAVCGGLLVVILRTFFPDARGGALPMLLLFGFTFDDRPEALAYVFGLGALWLVARQISQTRFGWGTAAALSAALLLGLYTSVIVGAYFFGAGFLACVAASYWRREIRWFAPFAIAAVLFALITWGIAKLEPLWWAGFMESARQQSVVVNGFALRGTGEILRVVRTVPVFLLALVMLPILIARRRAVLNQFSAWLPLTVGTFVAGWLLILACLTYLPSNYVNYALYTQVLLAAGLLALAALHFPARAHLVQGLLVACLLLVSVRAVGMTTWGAVCAWKNSYASTQASLRREMAPFTVSNQLVLVSSPYLYSAAGLGVRNALNCDWYFDHAHWTNNAQADALMRLRPVRMILTQFDYYRSLAAPLGQLESHSNLVAVEVRNLSNAPVPDANPRLQRVVQHISWAPVIVNLVWHSEPAPAEKF